MTENPLNQTYLFGGMKRDDKMVHCFGLVICIDL